MTIIDETITIHEDLDLVGSVDDGGYYFHYFDGDIKSEKTSVIYPNKVEAIASLKSDSIDWLRD